MSAAARWSSRLAAGLLLTCTLSGCATMRSKRIHTRYERRMARWPQHAHLASGAQKAHPPAPAANTAAAPPAPRVIIQAPPPGQDQPFTPQPSPLLAPRPKLGSDRYCYGQPCRDRNTGRAWQPL